MSRRGDSDEQIRAAHQRQSSAQAMAQGCDSPVAPAVADRGLQVMQKPGTERSRVLPVPPQIGATGGKAGLGQARRQAQHVLLRAAVAVGQGDGPGRAVQL